MLFRTDFDFKKYVKEATPWFKRNFGRVAKTKMGKKYQHQPLLGIIEELGELELAWEKHELSEIEDAIGDILVYMTDYCRIFKRGIDTLNHNVYKMDSLYSFTTTIAGKLCHSHLKMEQGIRGTREEHIESIYINLEKIITYLYNVCWNCNLDFNECLAKTWAKVKQRDWKTFPKNGVSE